MAFTLKKRHNNKRRHRHVTMSTTLHRDKVYIVTQSVGDVKKRIKSHWIPALTNSKKPRLEISDTPSSIKFTPPPPFTPFKPASMYN